jgi:hypothetical protein
VTADEELPMARRSKAFARWLACALATASAATPAPAQEGAADAAFPPETIEQLVAPIALYPDSLLAQVFMASTYPLEVVEAARWQKQHPDLKGDALEDALQQQAWDPSVKSLVAFPQVLEMMNDKLDWTQKLGDAFLAQQKDVMDAVQRLRARAKAEGNLETTKEQKVVVEQAPQTETTIIQIEPADPQVVYVPTYNPTVVYGAWPYPAYPPYSYYPPGYVAGSMLWFGAGMAMGAALWGDCDWGGGDVDIDVSRYNEFNRTNISDREGKWKHDGSHRKGVEYRDRASRERYGKGQRPGADSREAFRGRAEAGRQDLAKPGRSEAVQRDLGARGSQRPGASTRDQGLARAGDRGTGAQRPGAGPSQMRGGTERSPGAFEGMGSGSQVRRDSARGNASRQSARSWSGGGRGGGSSGGSRGGGGGRAGGGGRGGGGGRR